MDVSKEVFLTPREVGQRLPGTPAAQTVREWCSRGLVPGARRTPTGRWQIPLSVIDTLVIEGDETK